MPGSNPNLPSATSPLVPPNAFAPVAVVAIDPDSGTVFSAGADQADYSVISTIGTTTLKSVPGIYWGFVPTGTGTAAMVWNAYDIIVSGTTTSTNTLQGAVTPSALNALNGFGGIGVRFQGSLVVVTTGTAGSYNALWD